MLPFHVSHTPINHHIKLPNRRQLASFLFCVLFLNISASAFAQGTDATRIPAQNTAADQNTITDEKEVPQEPEIPSQATQIGSQTTPPKAEEVVIVDEPKPEPKWTDYVSFSPYAILRLTQKFNTDDPIAVEIFRVGVIAKGHYKSLSMVVEPQLAQKPKRSFYPSNIIVRQAYIKWDTPLDNFSVSAGVLYNRFGFYHDASFLGNIPSYHGDKVQSDYTLELAYNARWKDWGIDAWAQASRPDGINLAILMPQKRTRLLAPTDFESDTAGDIVAATRVRVAPHVKFGDFLLKLGLSGRYEWARINSITDPITKNVTAPKRDGGYLSFASDLTLKWRGYSLLGEYAYHSLAPSINYKDPGKSITRHIISTGIIANVFQQDPSNWLSLIQLTAGVSYGIYPTENFKELFARGGVNVGIYKYLTFTLEYAQWSIIGDKKKMLQNLEFAIAAAY